MVGRPIRGRPWGTAAYDPGVETASPVCVWLKRDLRVADHSALAEAVARSRGGAVFAMFVYEPVVLAQPEWNSSHTEFQRECLLDLEPCLCGWESA